MGLKHGPSAVQEGWNAHTVSALDEAFETNLFVPKLLTGARRVPTSMPAFYSLDLPEEAVIYTFLNGKNWSDTKGVLLRVAEKTKGK